MSYIKLYVHTVWGTKYRQPILLPQKRSLICRHIQDYAFENNIHVSRINGWYDHLHALISLKPTQSISKVISLLKGESSYWANRHISWDSDVKFGWQREYYASSVSPQDLERVIQYIDRQVYNHEVKFLIDEYEMQ